MRRLRFSIRQLIIAVAVAALVLWGGRLARDHFWPPPPPPIPAPELPEGLWFPYPNPPSTIDRRIYFNMDDSANKIHPPRTIVFVLDRAKRRWVREEPK